MLVKEVNMLNFEAFVNHSSRVVEQRVGNMSLQFKAEVSQDGHIWE